MSIHAVLNDETRHLIGGLELGLMKPSAFLINVSRGAIVDEAALVVALRESVIAGAALDVFSQEPMHVEHPMAALYEMDNVILFPHLTFYTEEAMRRLTEDTLARCARNPRRPPGAGQVARSAAARAAAGVVFGD